MQFSYTLNVSPFSILSCSLKRQHGELHLPNYIESIGLTTIFIQSLPLHAVFVHVDIF